MASKKKNASLVMPIGDPQDGFFYPNLTLMINSYNLFLVKMIAKPERTLSNAYQNKD